MTGNDALQEKNNYTFRHKLGQCISSALLKCSSSVYYAYLNMLVSAAGDDMDETVLNVIFIFAKDSLFFFIISVAF